MRSAGLAGLQRRLSLPRWRTPALRNLVIGTPMGLGALGLGFWAQGLMPGSSSLNGPLLEALLESPPPHSAPRQAARDDLRGVAAERSSSGPSRFGLAEPQIGRAHV